MKPNRTPVRLATPAVKSNTRQSTQRSRGELRGTGQVFGSQRHQDPGAPRVQGESEGADRGRQQQALGQPLPDDPPLAGAQRRPDGHFPGALRGAREQQVRYVRARNQKHQRHRAE